MDATNQKIVAASCFEDLEVIAAEEILNEREREQFFERMCDFLRPKDQPSDNVSSSQRERDMVREWLNESELPKMDALETMVLDWLVDGGECEGVTDEEMISVIPTLPPVGESSSTAPIRPQDTDQGIVGRVNEGASTSGLSTQAPPEQTGEGRKRLRDIVEGEEEEDIDPSSEHDTSQDSFSNYDVSEFYNIDKVTEKC
ncbi:hypothetical protein BSL78_19353 [Apostichopus japonicus]|uniref:Uncharacterized protein n=1 Tax=Stichopus japonicus TaxID=307972 RepID=A0A2G8K6Z9_STIJA|nr:hypothetical protein BSL78_19353 [Apostichopus japonicus]